MSQTNGQFRGNTRSVSPVVGVVLLVAVVVGGAFTIATFGESYIADSEESLEDEAFQDDIERMVLSIDSVMRGNPQADIIEFETGSERDVNGGVESIDDIGSVELIVNADAPDGTGGTTAYGDSVGGLIFSNDDQELQYKHGGIIGFGEDTRVLASPYVSYEGGPDATMTVRIVDIINSAAVSGSTTVSYEGSSRLYPDLTVSNSKWVVYEFETDNPEAWANHLGQTLDDDVTVETGSNIVRVAVQSNGDLTLHATEHRLSVDS